MKIISLRKTGFVLLSAALLPLLAAAQEKATIAVSSIKPTPSLAASVKPDKKPSLDRIVESLDSQLIDRINATRKFDVVGRSDLNDVIKEQDLGASGNVDAKTAAKAGKLTGAKYLLVATVDDFQDYVEKATFEGTGRSATKRVFRFSIIGKIYDATTGKLLESANFQTGNDAFKQIQEERNYSVKDGELSDEMMVAVSRTLAQQIAGRVVTVIYPPKILDVDGKQVTISWGDALPITVGETWEACFPRTKTNDVGDAVIILKPVGKVKITRVDETSSEGEIVGEDLGIAEHCVLRKAK